MVGTSSAAVVSAVLDVFELLEHILAYLPTKDLARSQRVCRQFQGVIDRSKSLQQQLFLLPRPATLWLGWRHEKGSVGMRPNFTRDATHAGLSYTDPIGTLHPALQDGRWEPIGYPKAPTSTTFDLNGMMEWPPGGQWECSFITQPPSVTAVLTYWALDGRAQTARQRSLRLEDADGVTLGAVRHELAPQKRELERLHRGRCEHPMAKSFSKVTIEAPGLVTDTYPWAVEAAGRARAQAAKEIVATAIPPS